MLVISESRVCLDESAMHRNTRRGAVYATLEPLLGKRRAHHVPAKSLELGAVVAIEAPPKATRSTG